MTVYSGLKLRRIHLHGFILSRVYRLAKKLILSRIIQIKLNQVKKNMSRCVAVLAFHLWKGRRETLGTRLDRVPGSASHQCDVG